MTARLTIVDRSGAESMVHGMSGLSVMEVIRGEGFDELLALCGGCLSCATCHVYVDDAFLPRLPPQSENESALLEAVADRRPGSRLSCQINFGPALDGLRVTIAPED